MTLSPTNPPRRKKLKMKRADLIARSRGPIGVQVNSRATRNRAPRSLKAVLALAILSAALFALPGQAFAGQACASSTDCQYENQVQQIASGLGGGPGGGGGGPAQTASVTAPASASSGSSLPFTGLDVAALAVVALGLTGTGVVLRRLATIGDSEK